MCTQRVCVCVCTHLRPDWQLFSVINMSNISYLSCCLSNHIVLSEPSFPARSSPQQTTLIELKARLLCHVKNCLVHISVHYRGRKGKKNIPFSVLKTEKERVITERAKKNHFA